MIHKSWIGLFGIWLLILSGIFAQFFGSPGLLQAYRLRSLLEIKQTNLTRIREDVARLKTEAHSLETSRYIQEREARRVLGYLASDELLFDFAAIEKDIK